MNNKKNCINIPGAICNITTRVEGGKRRISGLKKVKLNLRENTMDELKNQCRNACDKSSECYGSFGMSRGSSNRCYHCTTPKIPLKYNKVDSLQMCDDGTNPRYDYHNNQIKYEDLTSGFINLLNKESKSNYQLQKEFQSLTKNIESVKSALVDANTENELLEIGHATLTTEYNIIKQELKELKKKEGVKQETIDDLLNSLEEINAEIDEYEDSMEELNTLNQTLEDEYNTLELDFNNLEEEYAAQLENNKNNDIGIFFDDSDDDLDDDDYDDNDDNDEDYDDDDEVTDDISHLIKPHLINPKSRLPPHMVSAEPINKKCGDATLEEYYVANARKLEKCRGNNKWICKDGEWMCPDNLYDCSWGGKYAPERITTMEHCPWGRSCGKFGIGGCNKPSIIEEPTPPAFGAADPNVIGAVTNNKGRFGNSSSPPPTVGFGAADPNTMNAFTNKSKFG